MSLAVSPSPGTRGSNRETEAIVYRNVRGWKPGPLPREEKEKELTGLLNPSWGQGPEPQAFPHPGVSQAYAGYAFSAAYGCCEHKEERGV